MFKDRAEKGWKFPHIIVSIGKAAEARRFHVVFIDRSGEAGRGFR